ncbi:MAG TPA: ankyrin repeat domain-containing protein [Gemmataceae bacterium]|nr:ankyrin repeat domain-containing protein [Gemmataceae bacterium]
MRKSSDSEEIGPKDLNLAVLRGNMRLIKAILKAGAEADRPYHGRGTATAMVCAVGRGNAKVLRLLLPHAGKRLDPRLLSNAVNNGHADVVKVLLAKGLKPTPKDLVSAVTYRHLPVVRLLLAAGVKPTPLAVERAAGVSEGPYLRIVGYPRDFNRPLLRMLKRAGAKAPPELREKFEKL